MKPSHFSPDTLDLLLLLHEFQVGYVIVGGEAVIYYGHVRLTGDIDIFYEASPENARRLFDALATFWDGPVPGISSSEEFAIPGTIVQFGTPPNRIDLINRIEGVSFSDAWNSRVEELIQRDKTKIPLYFIGIEMLIQNKKAVGRYKDLDDLQFLNEALSKKK
jgi:hypothetical protein